MTDVGAGRDEGADDAARSRVLVEGEAWARLYEAGRRRGGAVGLGDADDAGLPRVALRRRAERETWPMPVGERVWLLPGCDPDDPRAVASAAVLYLGDRAVLSHGSAAWVHGLWDNPPSRVVCTVPADRDPDSTRGVRVVRSRTLLARDVVEVGGLRSTTADRTLRDIAAHATDAQLLDWLTVAEQRRLVDLDALVEQAARPGTAAGSARFRRMVELRRRDRTDSGLERDTAGLCRAHGFVPHDGPYPLRCPDGRTVHLDVAFPAVRFAIECDGVGFHADAASVQTDRRRWRQILRTGWRITWVTRADLRDRPDEVLAEVRDAHAAVAGRG